MLCMWIPQSCKIYSAGKLPPPVVAKPLAMCGDVFTASCDVEPAGCTVTWLLLLLSVIVHAMHWCATDECDSDDDTGPETMYS